MYRKTVRRRRAVLGLLVALALILLTAYFQEPVGGGLHSVQRGFVEVVSPIQDVASRALKPVRDLFGWFGSTLDAKSQRDQLKKQVQQLRTQDIAAVGAQRQVVELQRMLGLDNRLKLADYKPVTARVIGRSPTVWYANIDVDVGSSNGVRQNDPVVNGDGLVGKVTEVTPGASVVTLITDHTSGVSATVNQSGAAGIVQPAVGNPNDLLLQFVTHADTVRRTDFVVTAGTKSTRLDSLFPPGIPIGQVTRVDDATPFKSVHVRPFADLRNLDFVQVLTLHAQGVHP